VNGEPHSILHYNISLTVTVVTPLGFDCMKKDSRPCLNSARIFLQYRMLQEENGAKGGEGGAEKGKKI
jgi:hypothetical protein